MRAELYILCKFDCTILRNIAIKIYNAHVKDYTSTVSIAQIITVTSICTRTDHVVTILLVLVYVYDLGLSLLRESLPPYYKKLKNDNFTKILDASTKEFEFCKF